MTKLPADDVIIRETEELALAFLTRAREVTTRLHRNAARFVGRWLVGVMVCHSVRPHLWGPVRKCKFHDYRLPC